MPQSQNGYAANDRSVIVSRTVPGTAVKLPVRRGPTGDVLIAAAARWHCEVEPLVQPGNWGYAERTIRGSSTTLSNHASGTAIDLNAPKHPLGTDPARNFTPTQIAAVRRIVAAFAPALRWGGDYSGRKDGMHLEIVASEGVCAAVLARGAAPAAGGTAGGGRPTLRLGATGPAVELIQRFLGVVRAGQPGYGTFGPATEAAVRRYQQMKGLAVDGVVGGDTWRATGL